MEPIIIIITCDKCFARPRSSSHGWDPRPAIAEESEGDAGARRPLLSVFDILFYFVFKSTSFVQAIDTIAWDWKKLISDSRGVRFIGSTVEINSLPVRVSTGLQNTRDASRTTVSTRQLDTRLLPISVCCDLVAFSNDILTRFYDFAWSFSLSLQYNYDITCTLRVRIYASFSRNSHRLQCWDFIWSFYAFNFIPQQT